MSFFPRLANKELGNKGRVVATVRGKIADVISARVHRACTGMSERSRTSYGGNRAETLYFASSRKRGWLAGAERRKYPLSEPRRAPAKAAEGGTDDSGGLILGCILRPRDHGRRVSRGRRAITKNLIQIQPARVKLV